MWRTDAKENRILQRIQKIKSQRTKPKTKRIVHKPTSKYSKIEKQILAIVNSKDKATVRLGKIIKYLNDN